MRSALHRLWEIAFNFVNDIVRVLIGWYQLQKFSIKLYIWAEWRKKRKLKIAGNIAFVLLIFRTGILWNNL